MTTKINGTNTAANPAITGADTDTGLSFGTDTVNINTGGTTKVKIDSSGKLGIGTNSASEKLEVAGAINFTGAATSNQASCGKLTFESGTAFLQSKGADTSTRGKIGFNVAHSDGSSGITAMTIDTSGNVGIGLASATGKFAVSDGTVTAE